MTPHFDPSGRMTELGKNEDLFRWRLNPATVSAADALPMDCGAYGRFCTLFWHQSFKKCK